MTVEIRNLRGVTDRDSIIEVISPWNAAHWRTYYPNEGVEHYKAFYRECTESDTLPETFVALANGIPIGVGSIVVDDDLAGYEHLTPWLAADFVVREHRGNGTHDALVAARLERAQELGFKTIFAWTIDKASNLRRMGLIDVSHTKLMGTEVCVLSRSLTDP